MLRADFAVTAANAPSVARLCHRLDGIPLALELAAARVRAMPVQQIEARLDDRFRLLTGGARTALPRHQTLRGLIDWSYDLLNAQERALLARFSVFAGGATLEAAESVCVGEGLEAWDVLDRMVSLVDKSLVIYDEQEGQSRYRLLETVRQYAAERLEEQGERQTYRQRHRDHFLTLAEEAKVKFEGPEQGRWLNRLETEHDNLRQALTVCLEEGAGAEPGLRLGAALVAFWDIRGHLTEGRERLTALQARPEAQEYTNARADALNGAGWLACIQGDNASARSLYEEVLAIRRELGDRQGVAESVNYLGVTAFLQGDYATARSLYEESLAIRRELSDRKGIAISLNDLGHLALDCQIDSASARSLFEESLEIFRELGDKQGISALLNNLGKVAKYQRDYASARSLYQESLDIGREVGILPNVAFSLLQLGDVATLMGDYAAARSLAHESLTILRELGHKRGAADVLGHLGKLASLLCEHDSARSLHQESLEISRELGDRPGTAASLNSLGNISRDQGDYASARSLYERSLDITRELGDRQGIAYCLESFASLSVGDDNRVLAVRLWGAAERLREEIGSPLAPAEQEEHERAVPAARQALGEEAFDAAWAEGRAMTMEQAIACALDSKAQTGREL